jgi:hypothetical protein
MQAQLQSNASLPAAGQLKQALLLCCFLDSCVHQLHAVLLPASSFALVKASQQKVHHTQQINNNTYKQKEGTTAHQLA